MAVLAVGLHIVMACTGGRLCYWTLAAGEAEACPSVCCQDGTVLAAIELKAPPVESNDSDCCLQRLPDFLFHAPTAPGMRLDAHMVSSFAALPPSTIHSAASGPAVAPPIRLHGKPPPSLLTVQVTVLRL